MHYWSDGVWSQFKNRFNLTSIIYHPPDFGCEATWNFLETSHGKVAPDGVGAVIKRSIWRTILQNRTVINSAQEFASVANKECQKVEMSSTIIVSKNSQFALQDQDTCKEHCLITRIDSEKASQTQPMPLEPEHQTQEVGSNTEPSTKSKSKPIKPIKIESRLPKGFQDRLSCGVPFTFPWYKDPVVLALLEKTISSRGTDAVLIDNADLRAVSGRYATCSQEKWLSNFILDSYLKLLSVSCVNDKMTVIKWEIFEKHCETKIAANVLKNTASQQDYIFVPCNQIGRASCRERV